MRLRSFTEFQGLITCPTSSPGRRLGCAPTGATLPRSTFRSGSGTSTNPAARCATTWPRSSWTCWRRPITGHSCCPGYNNDGTLLATGCDDGLVRPWDPASGALLQTLAGHQDRVYAVDLAGSGLLASGSWDATVRV
jgi:WD40 repeat protein